MQKSNNRQSQIAKTIKVKVETQKKQSPILNGQYEVLSQLGNGKTSRVYLCKSLANPKQQYAMKLLREEYLKKDQRNIRTVENEIKILKSLNHEGIIKLIETGNQGTVSKPSGSVVNDLIYILLEYVPSGTLFSLCEHNGAMGEDIGRFFMSQILDVLSYMHKMNIVHRDLKLENLLLDENLTIKFADFGFARFQEEGLLKSQRGTMTYMAPEIKLGHMYDGKQADVFSIGVILFIVVLGIFPFQEAKKEEYFYNLIHTNNHTKYWNKVGGEELSKEFRSLIVSIFSFEGNKRPTLEEIANHPWMSDSSFNIEKTRQDLIYKMKEQKNNSSTDSAASSDV